MELGVVGLEVLLAEEGLDARATQHFAEERRRRLALERQAMLLPYVPAKVYFGAGAVGTVMVDFTVKLSGVYVLFASAFGFLGRPRPLAVLLPRGMTGSLRTVGNEKNASAPSTR